MFHHFHQAMLIFFGMSTTVVMTCFFARFFTIHATLKSEGPFGQNLAPQTCSHLFDMLSQFKKKIDLEEPTPSVFRMHTRWIINKRIDVKFKSDLFAKPVSKRRPVVWQPLEVHPRTQCCITCGLRTDGHSRHWKRAGLVCSLSCRCASVRFAPQRGGV